MGKKQTPQQMLSPHVDADKAWYLALLDDEKQTAYEREHLAAVLYMLKARYISRLIEHVRAARAEIESIRAREHYGAEDYRAIQEKKAYIAAEERKIEAYKPFFSEPYFARMDVVDEKEGYNRYYIGKHGDVNLEIVDWRAPLAVRYYQKSRVRFTINDYEYRTVLRRALSVKNGKLLDFRNEYLSVRDVLTPEEIGGRDEEILFDPYLRSILKSRKDDVGVRDIIRTIQEQQFEIVTLPERESFVLQGCAGSGKTMILLHRLSYLMYNNETIRPRDVLVITPSESFNAFIDELAHTLELQKVRTMTLSDYFFRTLLQEGIDLKANLGGERESEAYLQYLYSPRFQEEAERRVQKLYDEIFGLFAGGECREVAESLLRRCDALQERYVRIKNASLRVRRAVLGEMKENKEGGFYFTKPFRTLMSAFVQVQDFLTFVLREPPRTPDYFFRQFSEFYRCAHLVAAGAEKVFAGAQTDLENLIALLGREIADLKRYRIRKGEGEVFTYADRIARRRNLARDEGRYRMRGGRGAKLPPNEGLAQAPWLVIAEIDDADADGTIRLAAAVDGADIERDFAADFHTEEIFDWNPRLERVDVLERECLGAIPVRERPLRNPDPERKLACLCKGIRAAGLERLNWSAAATALRDRACFLRRLLPDAQVDVARQHSLGEALGGLLLKGADADHGAVELHQEVFFIGCHDFTRPFSLLQWVME